MDTFNLKALKNAFPSNVPLPAFMKDDFVSKQASTIIPVDRNITIFVALFLLVQVH